MRWLVAIATLAGAGAGCGGGSDPPVDAGPDPAAIVDVNLTPVPETDLDLLLVIDDSVAGPLELQYALGQELPGFFAALAGGATLPGLHVGVVSSTATTLGVVVDDGACDEGDGGALQQPGCPAVAGNFIADVGGVRNYTGSLEAALACLIGLGEDGCGFEQHFESMRLALDDHPANAGFLRPGAPLAVLVLADEDDCSARDPGFFEDYVATRPSQSTFTCFEHGVTCNEADPAQEGVHTGCIPDESSPYLHGVNHYVDFLESLRPGRVIVGTLVGDPEPVVVGRITPTGGGETIPALDPSCTAGNTEWNVFCAPGIRQTAFARAFGPRGAAMRVCADFAPQLAAFGTQIRDFLVGQPCLRATPRDSDLDAPGLQPACSVTLATMDQPVAPLLACDATASNAPCWRLVEDAAQCGPAPTAWRLDAVGVPALAGTHVQARCEVIP